MHNVKKRLIVRNKQGLHARPAALFVRIANKYKSDIKVKKGRNESDGKSIMGILSLCVSTGSYITIKAIGIDAEEAVDRLSEVVTSQT